MNFILTPGLPHRIKIISASLCLLSILTFSVSADSLTEAKPAFIVEKHGHGSPVILIPGLGCSGAVWQETVAGLEKSHECHVLTLAGFAGQPPISGSLLDVVPLELAKYIKNEKLSKPVVIGHSMGGFIAVKTASQISSQLGGIIVVDSVPFFGGVGRPDATEESVKPFLASLPKMIESQTPEQVVSGSKQTMAMLATSPESQQKGVDWMKASDLKTVGESMAGILGTDLRKVLPKIECRALILEAGVEPGAVPEETFKSQYSTLKGVKLERDPKARHFIMLDDPEFFMAQVKTFLGDK